MDLTRLSKGLLKPLTNYRIARSPDRVALVREMLPVFANLGGDILWVGVRPYTRGYPAMMERRGATCWTTDINPKNARFGQRGRHVTGDLTKVDQDFAAGRFSAVLCNGVFGFGLDEPGGQHAAFAAMAKVLRPGGWLLLGWNTDRTADPLDGEGWKGWFERAGLDSLPARRRIEGTTHVYDLLRRR